jgi:tRNA 2-selenouridine synthase
MELRTTNDFKTIVVNSVPLIDVRAPIEFEKGAIPGAINLPIMNDAERHVIGIKYKEDGNEEAVKLGHALVSGVNKQHKIEKWLQFIKKNPNAIIYCFRGGSRSEISQKWISTEQGREIDRIEGGYKAFRNYLIDAFEPENQNFKPIRLGGRTGSGKTPILNGLEYSVDLEGIANHRGSSFGDYITPQPSQIDFENLLAYTLIQKQAKGYSHLVFEDEGKNVGRRFFPKVFTNHYTSAPLVIVDIPLETRADNILNEYVIDSQERYIKSFGEEIGLNNWFNYIVASMNKAQKRLGGERHQHLIDSVTKAYKHQLKSHSIDLHLEWIHVFLKDYYDPMYTYQIEKQKDLIVFQGSKSEVIDYLNDLVKVL